jgi:acid phosphatase family membrane protein YuiD
VDIIFSFFKDPIFRAAFFSWFISQAIKSIIEIVRNRPHTAKEILMSLFWTTGGMPSSHSAVVSALATAIGFEVGATSPIFIVAVFYAFITVRDALGVRRAAGSQAKAINQIISTLGTKNIPKIKPVKEIHGHRISEVMVGILLGFFIAVAFCTL